ncbi:MAG: hypothetical protein OEY06_03165 [Gammaproteobacteria bacterium]|nr:hypothetical protein [Gammaproteobacteria bacterium]MDH5387432.1 hypothetical protein [Gammaproteobacteria bacterium]
MFYKWISQLTFLTTLFWASATLATNAVNKDSYPLITYECDPDKDILLVTNVLLKDGKEKDFKYSDTDGTYSPWDMVTIENNIIVDSGSIKKECQLSSAKYTIVLEPQVFNPKLSDQKLDGFCGATISAAITILSNNVAIMERKPFEFYCSGNTKIITGIKIIGKTGEVKTRVVPRYKYY